jgi:hypothetical protein
MAYTNTQKSGKGVKIVSKGIDNTGLLARKSHVTEINMLLKELN